MMFWAPMTDASPGSSVTAMTASPPGTASALPMVSNGMVPMSRLLVAVGVTNGGEVRVGVNVRVRVGVGEMVGVSVTVDVLVGRVALGVRVLVAVGESPIVMVGVTVAVSVRVGVR